MDYALKKTTVCQYHVTITGLTYFHWRKSFERTVIIEIPFTSTSESSLSPPCPSHWQGNLHTDVEVNTYLDHNIYFFINAFLFPYLSLIQINTVPNT